MRTANKVGYVMCVPFDDRRLDFERPLKSFGAEVPEVVKVPKLLKHA